MPRTPQLLHEILDRAADRDPESAALSSRDRGLTYRELATATTAMAARLRREGLRRGDRIIVTASDGIGIAILVYAASRVGAVFSVLHEQVRGEPLEHVLRDCEPALLVSDDLDAGRTAAEHGVRSLVLDELVRTALDADTAEPATPAGPNALDESFRIRSVVVGGQ
ncbi:AMP-binding protein [Streptomyces sp. NPDC006967]|uniref:AMP-binding protein n=1 Tax=Streptomyces sp. NPDC006967 TaxID=3156906 RepID=UPI0033FF08CB